MRVLENGILHVVYHKETIISEKDIREVQYGFDSLEDPKPTKVIQEMQENVSMSLEGRKYASENAPSLTGVAYVIKGLPQRLLVRFYVGMRVMKNTTKVFESFDEGIKWLSSLD